MELPCPLLEKKEWDRDYNPGESVQALSDVTNVCGLPEEKWSSECIWLKIFARDPT